MTSLAVPLPRDAVVPLRAAPLFSATQISKSWPAVPTPVLHEVDLEVAPASAVWIGGSNGVGKTTLLRVLAGILRPDSGHVALDGLDPVRSRQAFHRRVGFLSAGDRGLYARLTVRQHLRYWARLAYLASSERPRAIAKTIELLDLERLIDKRVDRLSQGQRQRVRLSLAMLHEPDLLLLDEPRNSLDDEGYFVLEQAVEQARARGAAVVWCSPRADEGSLRFDQHHTLEGGELSPWKG